MLYQSPYQAISTLESWRPDLPLTRGDPGGVDWPPLENSQPKKYDTWKNKRKYVGPKNLVKPTSLTM